MFLLDLSQSQDQGQDLGQDLINLKHGLNQHQHQDQINQDQINQDQINQIHSAKTRLIHLYNSAFCKRRLRVS